MKMTDIRTLDQAGLRQELVARRGELLRLNLRRRTGQVEKTHQFALLRRDIARLMTILNERGETLP